MKIYSYFLVLALACNLGVNANLRGENQNSFQQNHGDANLRRLHKESSGGMKMGGMKMGSMEMGSTKMGSMDSDGDSSSDDGRVTTFEVGARPEGSAPGPTKDTIYVSEILLGGVKLINIKTGEVKQVVPSNPARASVGLDTYKNAVFVAGGGENIGGAVAGIHVYDVNTGGEIVSCFPESALVVNDIVIKDGYLYATDSGDPVLWKFDVEALLGGECVTESIPLEPAADFNADFENGAFVSPPATNGIALYKKGLLICTSGFGSVHYLNLETFETTKIVDGDIPTADGLVTGKDNMYVISGNPPAITEYKLKGEDHPTAEFVRVITNEAFEFLATGVLVGKNKLFVTDVTVRSSPDYGEDFNPESTATFKVHVVDL